MQHRLWLGWGGSDRAPAQRQGGAYVIGVLPGEGIGPEVIAAALIVLRAVESAGGARFDLRFGGAIGLEAERAGGQWLSPEVHDFCRAVFDAGGAVLTGPGGGRFVYDLRRRLDLFCKLNPIVIPPELAAVGRLRPDHVEGTDILVVRDNAEGIYQGEWHETRSPGGERTAHHRFAYREQNVERILRVAFRLAQQRQGHLTVVTKPAGLPAVSRLWHDCAARIGGEGEVTWRILEIDYAAYALLQHPQQFDVIVTSNLFGDILSDLGGVLLGSRGLCFGGSFAADGAAVYQTNHGAARDLAGTDQANPAGQIFSLAMLLRESFGLLAEAESIERAVADVWRSGCWTADLARDSVRVLGTQDFARHVAAAYLEIAAPSLQPA
jgi:3-isopropylmalate dehydrogenase